MLRSAVDLAFNVGHAVEILPPNYFRSIFGDPDSWSTRTCPPTELQLADLDHWDKGLPALAHILIPALPFKPPGVRLPFSDLLFRPSVVFRYPAGARVLNPAPAERWFFLNGICTDRSVVELNAAYLHRLFRRPLTVLHNFTRGFLPDLAACAVGKEWDWVTASAAMAFPSLYAALKDPGCERLILLAHSQGTILSAVVLELLKGLHPPVHRQWAEQPPAGPEQAVAHKLAAGWDFSRSMPAARSGKSRRPAGPVVFDWPGHGRRQPEPVGIQELRKVEIYCFANCATEMRPVRPAAPWIESYGNAMDIVARLGLLANESGPGSTRIEGDRYRREDAWGHLLNAHYLYPMMKARAAGDPAGGMAPFERNRFAVPRLFEYLQGRSAPALAGVRGLARTAGPASTA